MRIDETKAYQYAVWCLDDAKAPKYVKLQAKSWLNIADGNDNEAYVDIEAVKQISALLKVMVHPDLHCSMYDGLEDYAWFLIVAIYCTKLKCDRDIRYYITAVLEIARKNFKTFNSAVIFVIGMLTEPRFSRFFSVAPDLKLSSELKLAIRKIIKASPCLMDDGRFKILRSEIRCLLTDSTYTPLAYSNDRIEGSQANLFLADEAGAMDAYPIEAMRSSQITLHNKLGIVISTQYPNDNNGMIDEIDISKKTLDGLLDNRRRFSLLYEPDDKYLQNELWKTDDNVIYQSNPVAVAHPYIYEAIRDARTAAILYENKRENYLCKHNNIKYKGLGVQGYIDIIKVKQCRIKENPTFWKGKRVFLGLDLSMTDDNTAVSMVCEDDGKIYAKVWAFIPADRVGEKSKKEQVDYTRLIRQGVCIPCGDSVIDYLAVESFILELEQKYGVEIVQVGYDRYNALSTVQKLEENSLDCVDITQHSSILHMPTKLLKENVLQKRFQYEENRLLEINFENARCTEDTNLRKYVNKKKSTGKVDMVIAVINAVYLLQQEQLFGDGSFVAQT